MSTTQDYNTNEQNTKNTRRRSQKIYPRKNTKETELKNENDSSCEWNFNLITISLGYIINTFFYFLYIHIFDKILNKLIYILFKATEYDYADSLVIRSIKIIIILTIWYKYISGGYNGDPLFHLFKCDFKLINKREALLTFFSTIIGALFFVVVKIIFKGNSNFHLSNIIVEYIQKKQFHKNKSFLTAFVYPNLPLFLKNFIMKILIFSCPYNHIGNRYIDRIFINNMELYSSIIMDCYISEFICSFLSYILLYIYLYTGDILSHPVQINLVFTQLISFFANKCSYIIGGPFMNLNWIVNDCLQKKLKLLFLFFLIFFHYFGYKLASLILKNPRLSLVNATKCYKNVDKKTLQENLNEDGIVDVSLISNEHIKYSDIADTYLGFIFQKLINSHLLKLSNKKKNLNRCTK